MATFNNASDAVRCAVAMQRAVKDEADLNLRIGIHLDEIVFEHEDAFGDGVNIAARIEAAGRPGAVFISEAVCSAIRNKDDITTRFVKQMQLKGVNRPIDIHEVAVDGVFSASRPNPVTAKSASANHRRLLFGVPTLAIILLAGWALSDTNGGSTSSGVRAVELDTVQPQLGLSNSVDGINVHDSTFAASKDTAIRDTSTTQTRGGHKPSERENLAKGFLTANGRLYIFTEDGKSGVRSTKGIVIPAVYDDITFVPELDVFGAESGSTMCAFNAFGKTIVPCDTYESIEGIQDEKTERYWSLLYAHRVDKSNSQIGGCIYDLSGNVLNGCSTRMLFTGINGTIEAYDGRALFQVGGKLGFINEQGKAIVPPIYEDLTQFHEGLAGAQKGGRWGLIDKFGQTQVQFAYDEVWIHPIGEGLFLAEVAIGGKHGLIDRYGTALCPVKYESIGSFYGELAPVNLNGKWGFISPVGKEVITCQYGEATNFDKDGVAALVKRTPDARGNDDFDWAVIGSDGVLRSPFQFDVRQYSGGWSAYRNGECRVGVRNGGEVVINRNGKILREK